MTCFLHPSLAKCIYQRTSQGIYRKRFKASNDIYAMLMKKHFPLGNSPISALPHITRSFKTVLPNINCAQV